MGCGSSPSYPEQEDDPAWFVQVPDGISRWLGLPDVLLYVTRHQLQLLQMLGVGMLGLIARGPCKIQLYRQLQDESGSGCCWLLLE